MPKAVYMTAEGERMEHEVRTGLSLMQGALRNSVPGIEAECGGQMACATCHVYVDEAWLDRTGKAGEIEDEMLEMTPLRRPNSRLSCQVIMKAELDGVVVHIPKEQMNVSL